MAKYKRVLRHSATRGDYGVTIPPAMVRGLGWKGGDLLELVDKPEEGIIVIKLAEGGVSCGHP